MNITNTEKKPHTNTYKNYTQTHTHAKKSNPNWINFEEKNFKEVLAESWGKNYFKNCWAGSFNYNITPEFILMLGCKRTVILLYFQPQKHALLKYKKEGVN